MIREVVSRFFRVFFLFENETFVSDPLVITEA